MNNVKQAEILGQVLLAAKDGCPSFEWIGSDIRVRARLESETARYLVLNMKDGGTSEIRFFRNNEEYALILFSNSGNLRVVRIPHLDPIESIAGKYMEEAAVFLYFLGYNWDKIEVEGTRGGQVFINYLAKR